MGLVVRRMRGSDRRAIAELSEQYFPLARIDEGEVRRRVANGMIYYVAELGGKVVGFVDLKLHERNARLSGIAVHPKHKERGVGSALLKKALDFARENGKVAVMLKVKESNSKAIRFYTSHGFSTKGAVGGKSGGVLILKHGIEN